jgi:hypothetical protein
MAVNRYDKNIKQQYVSQFIPENLQLMQQSLLNSQAASDKAQKELDLYEDELLKEKALPMYDTDELKNIRKEYDDFALQMGNRDLSDSKNQREIANFIRRQKSDPRLGKIRQGLATRKAYEDLKSKYSEKEFQYVVANDPMLKAYDDYLKQSGDNKKFAIDFISGKDQFPVGVDTYKNRERFYDHIPTSGWESIASVGEGELETFYKHGQKGVFKNKILQTAATEFDDYYASPGGQQEMRELTYNYPDATQEQKIKALRKDFINTGLKRVGVVSTTGKAGALNSAKKKKQEKDALDYRAKVAAGNTTMAEIGAKYKAIPGTKGIKGDAQGIGQSVLGGVIQDYWAALKNNPATVLFDPKFIKDSFKKNAFESVELQEIDENTAKRVSTAMFNIRNSMSPGERANLDKLTPDQQVEFFNNRLEDLSSKSVTIMGEVPLDTRRKQQLNDLATLSSATNARVYPLEGGDENKTLGNYIEEGYEIKDKFILQNNVTNPGNRLGLRLESPDGEIVRVAAKGAEVLSGDVSNLLPSAGASYVGDMIARTSLNYEESNTTIPLNTNEYFQTSPNKEMYHQADYKPQGGGLHFKTNKDGYSIKLSTGSGPDFTMKFPIEKQVTSTPYGEGHFEPGTTDVSNSAYTAYQESMADLKEIWDSNLDYSQKVSSTKQYIDDVNSVLK